MASDAPQGYRKRRALRKRMTMRMTGGCGSGLPPVASLMDLGVGILLLLLRKCWQLVPGLKEARVKIGDRCPYMIR